MPAFAVLAFEEILVENCGLGNVFDVIPTCREGPSRSPNLRRRPNNFHPNRRQKSLRPTFLIYLSRSQSRVSRYEGW
jgi:hypothetical protein